MLVFLRILDVALYMALTYLSTDSISIQKVPPHSLLPTMELPFVRSSIPTIFYTVKCLQLNFADNSCISVAHETWSPQKVENFNINTTRLANLLFAYLEP